MRMHDSIILLLFPVKRVGQDAGPVLRHRTSNCNAALYYSHPDISSKRTLTKVSKPMKEIKNSSEFIAVQKTDKGKLLPPDKKNLNCPPLKRKPEENGKQNYSLRTKFMKFMKKKGDPFTPNKTV